MGLLRDISSALDGFEIIHFSLKKGEADDYLE